MPDQPLTNRLARSRHCRSGHQPLQRRRVRTRHSPPYTAERYQHTVKLYGADWVALSGWLKPVRGLDPRTTFNIHPGPLPRFGGKGMHGHHVHEAVLEAFHRGEIRKSAVSMHFVTDFPDDPTVDAYDKGPVFFHCSVDIMPDDTAETLGKRVNDAEHQWQPLITDLVIKGCVSWDGVNPRSLTYPDHYPFPGA